jgi:hypothetical protein
MGFKSVTGVAVGAVGVVAGGFLLL